MEEMKYFDYDSGIVGEGGGGGQRGNMQRNLGIFMYADILFKGPKLLAWHHQVNKLRKI